MAAEANHRIANNLSMIVAMARLRASVVSKYPRMMRGSEVCLILEEFAGCLDTLAERHAQVVSQLFFAVP